jgi:hypothetical protein
MRLLLQSSTALWRRGVMERVALVVFGFPREQPILFLLFNRYAEHLRKPVFLLQRYSRDTQSTTWVLISCCLAHFISHRGKSNAARAKTALREIQG